LVRAGLAIRRHSLQTLPARGISLAGDRDTQI
jgi:hypothetical protein